MWNRLIQLEHNSEKTLQIQIREQVVNAIVSGLLNSGQKLPSSRLLSAELKVARNTVTIAYELLESEGYLQAINRRGYFVSEGILCGGIHQKRKQPLKKEQLLDNEKSSPDWCSNLLVKKPSKTRTILKCRDWKDHEFPFVYGQLDPKLIPHHDWREVIRSTSSIQEIRKWNIDYIDEDDPFLIEQLQSKVLPRRGIWAKNNEILLTSGSQNAMYIIVSLLVNATTRVGIENPCYPDLKNTLSLKTSLIDPIELDKNGLVVESINRDCDFIYTTPSHQYPTGVTMSLRRRNTLLQSAQKNNFVILEDDYDAEINFMAESTPALKSIDDNDRVIYIGSFSKSFAPGLRIGFIVAPAQFIREARDLRRLMQRHQPVNNQRAAAYFLSLGHYHAMFPKIHAVYKKRWQVMAEAIEHYPYLSFVSTKGGSAFWIKVHKAINTRELCMRLLQKSVVIEPGDSFFLQADPPTNYIRLAYSSIHNTKIKQGIDLIAAEIEKLDRDSLSH